VTLTIRAPSIVLFFDVRTFLVYGPYYGRSVLCRHFTEAQSQNVLHYHENGPGSGKVKFLEFGLRPKRETIPGLQANTHVRSGTQYDLSRRGMPPRGYAFLLMAAAMGEASQGAGGPWLRWHVHRYRAKRQKLFELRGYKNLHLDLRKSIFGSHSNRRVKSAIYGILWL